MKWLVIVGVGIGVYGLHRLALWMETKGWIFYIHKKPSPNTLGNAVLSVEQLIRPGAEHVLKVRQNQRVQRDDSGGPDKTGNKDLKGTSA